MLDQSRCRARFACRPSVIGGLGGRSRFGKLLTPVPGHLGKSCPAVLFGRTSDSRTLRNEDYLREVILLIATANGPNRMNDRGMPTTIPSPADRGEYHFFAIDKDGRKWRWNDSEMLWIAEKTDDTKQQLH